MDTKSVVGDWMTKGVASLTPEMSLKEMDAVLVQRGVSGAPVLERGRLVGVASQWDVVYALWADQRAASRASAYHETPMPLPISLIEQVARQGAEQAGRLLASLKVRDIMSPDPIVAHPDEALGMVAARMLRDSIHRLPVVDRESGALVGILSALDVVRACVATGA